MGVMIPDIFCLLCHRPIPSGAHAMYVTKGELEYNRAGTGLYANLKRFGGKSKPKGVICFDCVNNKLPGELHIKDN